MGFRHLYIKNAKELRLKDNNIKIIKKDAEIIELPLEDIASILLEDHSTLISSWLLTELSKYSITLTLCNEKFLPSTQVVPLNSYFNQAYILKLQLNSNQQLKDNLWKSIIKTKIMNQLQVIKFTTGNDKIIELLTKYYRDVKVGDKENKEGISARVFFQELYGEEFVRFGSGVITQALNYGYSILHGAVVRHLISIGANTNFGIWHNSNQNAYNLASDLIEPYRAIVDYYIYWNIDLLEEPLSKKTRQDLIDLLNARVLIDNKKNKIENAILMTCESYIRCLEHNDSKYLLLPEIIEVNFFE